jgi:glucokinase
MSYVPGMSEFGLVADAGGTNVRFALVDPGGRDAALRDPRKYTSRDFSSIEDAARDYLQALKLAAPPASAVLSVAGPVQDNAIDMTNLGWRFSGDEFGKSLGIASVQLINDYEAIAHSIAALKDSDLRVIGPSISARCGERETVAIVGPGTGLGVGGYVRTAQGLVALVTEGGHADFAPSDDTEIEILKFLRRKFGHVSNERVLSGPGLMNLHEALSDVEGVPHEKTESHDITARALAEPNSFCRKVLDRFFAILGSVAGDVALTMGARDGVMFAGGILPAVADVLVASDFRARFEAKGRFEKYMKAIPTHLIVNDNAGLLGAAVLLKAHR